jgi:hypothetical protein
MGFPLSVLAFSDPWLVKLAFYRSLDITKVQPKGMGMQVFSKISANNF